MPDQREVTFFAPAIGERVVPYGVQGLGTVSWSADGLTLTGAFRSQGAASLFGCLSFLVSFALGIVLAVAMKDAVDIEFTGGAVLAIAVGGTALGIRFSKVVVRPRTRSLTIPWASLGDLSLDGSLVRVIANGKPKGSAWFALGAHSAPPEGVEAAELFLPHKELVAALKAASAAPR